MRLETSKKKRVKETVGCKKIESVGIVRTLEKTKKRKMEQ